MPLKASWVEEKIAHAFKEERLAHAFILAGSDLDALENLVLKIASQLLDVKVDAVAHHPDLHWLKPESKSRRILIHQMRELEHDVRLKPLSAPCKIAVIVAADRMCVGSAEAAQAFLKTLEEPPEDTYFFLLTTEPEQITPTICSRCLFLPVTLPEKSPSEALRTLGRQWMEFPSHPPIDRVYRRAQLLTSYWQAERERIEAEAKKASQATDPAFEPDEKVEAALLESRFILARSESLKYLATLFLEESRKAREEGKQPLPSVDRAIQALDELSHALSVTMDASLAVERFCLQLSRS